jgi:hypothetical protein
MDASYYKKLRTAITEPMTITQTFASTLQKMNEFTNTTWMKEPQSLLYIEILIASS